MESILKYRVRRFRAHGMEMVAPRKTSKPSSHVSFKRVRALTDWAVEARLPSDMYFEFFSISWCASHQVLHEFTCPRADDTAGRPRRVLAQVRRKRQRDWGEQPRTGGEGDCLSVWPLLSPLALDKNLI